MGLGGRPRCRAWGDSPAPHLSKQEELESFPLSAIVRCDAVLPPGRGRALLLLVCQEPERAQPDVHFFQGLRLGVSRGDLSNWVGVVEGRGHRPQGRSSVAALI